MPREHVDVLVVGAGLSGIGAAAQLRRRCPGRSVAVLEAREAIGGTWDLFRYPGVRSDSDMHTLGYSFRPWTGATAIADGAAILRYIRDTARETGVEGLVRFGHRVVRAQWSGASARWTVDVELVGTGERTQLTCYFLHACTGYYRYDAGYTPELPGLERFGGRVVHPQHWPADLDTTGRRVVVIGSGATAVTLLPALAGAGTGTGTVGGAAEHVTMLQRSPSWVLSLHRRDALAERLRGRVPAPVAHEVVRWKNALVAQALYQLSRRAPGLVRRLLLRGVRRQLPEGHDVERHFTPRYDPWDQRLCFVPGGDLFRAIRSGRASVVTDTIDTFTEAGVRVASGQELEADVVVTATGLDVLAIGGMSLVVDGADVDVASTVAYKGMMLSGVPNFALALGYPNASWTLKVDLVNGYVCRLLNRMAARGEAVATPLAPPTPERAPLLDLQSGYVRRGLGRLPVQGVRAPWRLHQDYPRDVLLLRLGRLDDEGIRFSPAPETLPGAVPTTAATDAA